MGNLANLVGLFLDDNNLLGEIPPELGNLVNLRALYLSDNNLSGCVPRSLRHQLLYYELGAPFCPTP